MKKMKTMKPASISKRSSKLKHSIVTASLAALLAFPTLIGTAAAEEAPSSRIAIRDLIEKAGGQVQWDGPSQTVTVKQGGVTLVLKVGSAEATVNGTAVDVGEPIQVVSGKTMVPISFLQRLQSGQIGGGGGESAAPGDTTTEKDEDVMKATRFVSDLNGGKFAEAAKALSPNLQPLFPEAALKQLWQSVAAQVGELGKPVSSKVAKNAVHHTVTFSYQVGAMPIDVIVKLDPAGLVDDFLVTAAQPKGNYNKPAYDKADTYTEQEVVVGEGAFALPGTLTMPKGDGPFPAVVLVHGSGPNDRDSSVGGAKPLRDLAVGLAGQGIAVLRYEKVTKEHPLKYSANPKTTLQTETIDDAFKAIALLKTNKAIDSSRIFVAGHSQGGYAAPRMIELDQANDIAGVVILAGPSLSYADTLIDQQQLLIQRAKGLGIPTGPIEQSAAPWFQVAKMVNDPQYTVDHMPSDFPMPQPYWWFEQKNYVPGEVAKKQTKPLFIIQGENDWQVSMKQFDFWKQELKDRANVQFKSYPKVNHLLTVYDGVSIGAEYAQSANVSADIIKDVAAWVNGTPK